MLGAVLEEPHATVQEAVPLGYVLRGELPRRPGHRGRVAAPRGGVPGEEGGALVRLRLTRSAPAERFFPPFAFEESSTLGTLRQIRLCIRIIQLWLALELGVVGVLQLRLRQRGRLVLEQLFHHLDIPCLYGHPQGGPLRLVLRVDIRTVFEQQLY